ncbi:MAG: hypothetical protein HY352_06135 [Candidatus Omnitrophica bacterium]|nr:hypothetical protein [Candidatus Omnitrophota bacterium]
MSLPFTFEYPAAWVAAEEDGRGAAYQQVLILGPRNTSDTYTAGLTIRVMPTQAAGGKYAALEDLVQWRRAQHARAQALTSLRDGPTQVLGLPGAELEFQFQATVPPGGAPHGATQMTLKTHTVLVAHDERLYEFAFSADAADYDRYHPAFDRLLHTLHLTR